MAAETRLIRTSALTSAFASVMITGVGVLALGVAPTARATVTFTPLGFLDSNTPTLPTALSANGRVAVGYSQISPGQGTRAVRWIDGGPIQNLTPTWPSGGASNTAAYAVSADGSVIAGNQQTGNPNVGWLRREGVGFATLPSVGNTTPQTLSDDGLTSIGTDSEGAVAWRSGVRSVIGRPANAAFVSPLAVTPDGGSFVGWWRDQANVTRAVRWSEASGFIDLGLPASMSENRATGISGDGQRVVGTARTALPQRDSRAWVLESGSYQLLAGPGGAFSTSANKITPDGRVIAGSFSLTSNGDPIPCVWIDGVAIDVQALLLANGANFGGWDLNGIIDVSDDGRTVLGIANRQGSAGSLHSAAWIATIPSPGGAGLLGAGLMLAVVRRRSR